MTASAQGKDFSAFQAPITRVELDGLSFAFAKATDGLMTEDANFAASWAVMKTAKTHRGAYHELWPSSWASPQAQASRFLAVVKARGLGPGDMLAVVASDYAGVTDAEVKAFADMTKAGAVTSPVLVYSDLSMGATLTSCTGYDLWTAWPSATAPASVTPWKTWRLWQWGQQNGVDCDAFNGTAAQLQAWLDSVAHPKPPADWTYGAPQDLTAHGGHTSVALSWKPPAGAPVPPDHYRIYIYDGDALVASYPRTADASPWQGGGLRSGVTYGVNVVACGPGGSRVRPDTYAHVTVATG